MSANDVYTRLRSAPSFHPGSVEIFDEPFLEAGDVVTVESDGDSFPLPIYTQHIHWNGSSLTTLEATGNEVREELPPLRKRSSYGSYRTNKEVNEELKEIYYYTDFTKTDRGIGLLARAIGVKIDPTTGLPAIGQDSKWQFDENGATLTGQINLAADAVSAEVIQARGSSSSLRSALDLKANSASLSAVMDSNGNVTAASVVASINARTGQSLVKIEADQIDINGIVTALETAALGVGSLHVEGRSDFLQAAYFEAGLTSDETISATGFEVGNVALNVANVVPSGNTLTITYVNGTTTTFSKATALSGAWNSGILTVEASPQNEHYYDYLGAGTETRNGNVYTVPITHSTSQTGQFLSTGYSITVDASDVWQDGYDAGGGGHVTPTLNAVWGSDAQAGRLTVDSSPASTNPLEYWFSSGTPTWNRGAGSLPVTTAPSQTGTATTRFNLSIDASSVWNGGGKTAWLSSASAAGANHQGTLAANTYYCPRYVDANGNVVAMSDYTWLTPSSGSTTHSVKATLVGTYSSQTDMRAGAASDNGGTEPSIASLGTNVASMYILFKVTCNNGHKKYYFAR